MKQGQFLEVKSDEEAHRLITAATKSLAPQNEAVSLDKALGRVLYRDLTSSVDVPGFDRSNVDGFAIKAEDSFGAEETEAKILRVLDHRISAGIPDWPDGFEVAPGEAVSIATGAIMPRGADAVVMVEDTAPKGDDAILLFRAVAPGANLSGAGTDLGQGEIVLHRGRRLGSRETALAAAVGRAEVDVFRRPRIAIISTGDEIRPPGADLSIGEIFDSNGRVLADAITELGGEALSAGILPDDEELLLAKLQELLPQVDGILMSGGTSKGAGDLNHRIVKALAEKTGGDSGVVVHGVALKPGKPFFFAMVGPVPIAVLPGFPTSAIFTFHEFVAPIIRRLSGVRAEATEFVRAVAPMRIPSMAGRTEYLLVDLVDGEQGLAAYPLGRGSGSVSTFSAADGYVRIARHQEFIDEGESLEVRPLGRQVERPDLVAIGSHCIGFDRLLARLSGDGFHTKAISVGSQGGLAALRRGEGDIAGMHLLDEKTGIYNTPFLEEGMEILGGYQRRQGLVFRRGDPRFSGRNLEEMIIALGDGDLIMVNRNRGSGTRILIDEILARVGTPRPRGYHQEAKSHHAVAAAIAQGRADWGVTLDGLAAAQNLDFVFFRDERYDLVINSQRSERPAVVALNALLTERAMQDELSRLGFEVD